MKHLLKKFEIKRLIVAAITAFTCVSMWGCSDQVEFKWSDSRGTPSIAGFIDDSLVVAYDCRGWLETTETWNGGYSDDESCGLTACLSIIIECKKMDPRWTDSHSRIKIRLSLVSTDFLILFWRWEGKNILLWKIGETAHEMKLSRKNEGCSQEFEINRISIVLIDGFIGADNGLQKIVVNMQFWIQSLEL